MYSGLEVGARFYWRWDPGTIYTKKSDEYASFTVDGREFYQSMALGEMVELVVDEQKET